MRKDPTEFRKRFAKWKVGAKPYQYGIPYEDDSHNTDYDQARANQLNYSADETGHYPTRDYETGRYLKSPTHPTVTLGTYTDMGLGYDVWYNKLDKSLYSQPNFTSTYKDRLPKFEEGAEPDYQLSSDFISRYEGWSDTAYQKKGDVPTIGYGTTNPKWVSKGRITKKQGIQAMHEDLAANEPLLHKNIKDYDRLPDTAKTVLRDILYNVGQGNMFRKSPKFIDAMNAGNYEEAARQMDWDENKPGFGGAKIRNQARREMFLLDLKKNPVKPRSQLVQLMYDKPEFQPGFQYTPTTLTDYSLTNRAGGSLNAWNGAGSPSYGGAAVRIPSLYLTIEQNTFVPRKKHRQ